MGVHKDYLIQAYDDLFEKAQEDLGNCPHGCLSLFCADVRDRHHPEEWECTETDPEACPKIKSDAVNAKVQELMEAEIEAQESNDEGER